MYHTSKISDGDIEIALALLSRCQMKDFVRRGTLTKTFQFRFPVFQGGETS